MPVRSFMSIVMTVAAFACRSRTPATTPQFPVGWRVVDLTWPLAPDVPTFSG